MARVRLGVALLIPPPVATEVDGLRRACGDPALTRIAPHVTLVPPVNVREDRVDEACDLLRAAAATAGPFRLVVGPAATFWPDSPVLYLSVGGDHAALLELRSRVFVAPLARSLAWPFVPHVTLADGLSPERLDVSVAALSDYSVVVHIDRVHLLREIDDGHRWVPMADAAFGAPAVVGRGGLALQLAVTTGLDPEAQRFFEAAWAGHVAASYGPETPADVPFAVTARDATGVVGVALGVVRDELVLDRLVVAPASRRLGVGSQLLRAVEDLAAARGCRRAVLVVRTGSAAQALYAGRGWTVTLALPAWRSGRDFVRMERAIPPL